MRPRPPSPNACDARPSGAASRTRRTRSSSATARNGFWGVATEMFPGAIQIVDCFHVSEKLWEVARTLFPAAQGQRRGVSRGALRRCSRPGPRTRFRRPCPHMWATARKPPRPYALHRRQPCAHALRQVPRPRLVDRLRRGRGELQDGRGSPHSVQHVLDQRQGRRNPRLRACILGGRYEKFCT